MSAGAGRTAAPRPRGGRGSSPPRSPSPPAAGSSNPLASDAAPAEPAAAGGRRTPRPTPAASSPTPPTRWRSPATATPSRPSPTRVGTTTDALARRNALPEDYHPAPGRGAAPARRRGAPAAGRRRRPRHRRRSPTPAARRSTGAPRPRRPRPQANPFQNGQTEPLIDPVRHRVEAGETAYSIARLYGVSVTALASWNGLGPDLAVRENQELLIPIVSDANRISTAADGTPSPARARRSRRRRAPRRRCPPTSPPRSSRSRPNLGALRTPPGGRLAPAGLGKVTRPYDGKNGVGFAVPAGHGGEGGGPGRGGAGLRGPRRARGDRARPPQGRPDDHLLDARRRAR